MADEHDLAEPQPVKTVLDFEISWRDRDSSNGHYPGMTGSGRDGDYLSLTRDDESWIINLREVVAIKITKWDEGS